MQEFLNELSSSNFSPPQLILDGKIHRFSRNGSKDSAWYIGWQNHLVKDGSEYIVSEYGDFKTGERYLFKPNGSKLATADKEAIRVQLEESKRKSEEEKKRRQNEAADKSEKYWRSGKTTGTTDYMRRKRIDRLYGAKIHENTLQIPLRDVEGKLWGLQYIFDNGKRFLTGSKVDGCFHIIGELKGEAFLCEGYSTGCSIYQATQKTTIITFNAGNLISVAKALKNKYPDIVITVCGDDDRFTVVNGEHVNTGRIKAEKAALMAHGGVIFPVFENDDADEAGGKGPTDFNDLHVREGLEVVKGQLLKEDIEVKVGFIPLGYDDGAFFFYHVPTRDIVKATTFSRAQMYQIAPAAYWNERYPTKSGDADMGAAINDVIQMCKTVGPFDSTRIRGTGVWIDEGRIVINLGHCLVVDKKETTSSAIKSWHIYIQTRNRLPPMSKPLTVNECKPLIDACLSLKWRDSKSGYLLAGWLAIARIAGALPIHPHVWLTGGSGTGKSTVMDRLISPSLGGTKGKIYLQGSSTEAGIRQRMKCSAIPPIFDEFETTGDGSKERIANLVELLRNTWSATQGSVVKGTTSGMSVEYSLQFAALVSSIRVNLENDADRSRFSVIELAPHQNDIKHWTYVKESLKKINECFGERLFARSANLVHTIRSSQELISEALAGQVNQRYGQQVGTLLAGWWSLTSDNVIDSDVAKALAKELDLYDEKADSEVTDETECLNHLMSWKILVRHKYPTGGSEQIEISLGEAVMSTEFSDNAKVYGVKLNDDKICIADGGAEIAKIFKGTRWTNWSMSLRRLPGAQRTGPIRFPGIQSRAVSIPSYLIKK